MTYDQAKQQLEQTLADERCALILRQQGKNVFEQAELLRTRLLRDKKEKELDFVNLYNHLKSVIENPRDSHHFNNLTTTINKLNVKKVDYPSLLAGLMGSLYIFTGLALLSAAAISVALTGTPLWMALAASVMALTAIASGIFMVRRRNSIFREPSILDLFGNPIDLYNNRVASLLKAYTLFKNEREAYLTPPADRNEPSPTASPSL